MTINTKFNVGDIVYGYRGGHIRSVIIKRIVAYSMHTTEVEYFEETNGIIGQTSPYKEHELGRTKEEILENLKNDLDNRKKQLEKQFENL